ncbi:hypothetical protein [Castellaniella caeni]|uniref:hypothetical protein n=1 Tax=Castellaniella caeni TaxID=266123 RepID=UPI00215541A3|nr:hypothetical protein [Castellaniella caeni]
MALPTFHCPCCRNPLTLEVVLANEAVRDCIVLLMDAHPSASGLLRPLMAYLGLFAPAKQAIRYERMAALLEDLVPMIRACQVERGGRSLPAPLDYWKTALEEVVQRGHSGALTVPLKSHGYLLEVVVQMTIKADAQAEAHTERQRAGHAGLGTAPARSAQAVTTAEARTLMPAHIREQLFKTVKQGTAS